ncbi:hypothetical protein [Sedimenticola selenatireducens]|uniref:hypothetical protein n=1 Tax=Sedimenticola selenatireducens TaxID=191960 RepID=UPI0012FBF6A0|nr:hypothetical protein [Sedimenticola selenatireducens]
MRRSKHHVRHHHYVQAAAGRALLPVYALRRDLEAELGIELEIRFCDDGAEVPPPAMLIYGALITPSDGVILSPEDIAGQLRDRLSADEVAKLARLLEETQEQWMEEWSDG